MFSLLGPALSFGASLLQGFGAQQSAKKMQRLQMAYEQQAWNVRQNVASEILGKYDFKNIPTDAQAAGFNPVTWLGALGPSYGALIQQGYAFKGQAQAAPTVQVPSGLEVFGGAAVAGVNTLLTDMRAQQAMDFQRQMQATQIAAIQRNGGRPLTLPSAVPAANTTFFGSGSIPYSVTAGSKTTDKLVEIKPAEMSTTVPGAPHIEPGFAPDVDYGRSHSGWPIQPGKITKERIEDDPFQQFSWWMRNNVAASLGWGNPPPHVPLKAGRYWDYSIWSQEWQQRLKPLPFPEERFNVIKPPAPPRNPLSGWGGMGAH